MCTLQEPPVGFKEPHLILGPPISQPQQPLFDNQLYPYLQESCINPWLLDRRNYDPTSENYFVAEERVQPNHLIGHIPYSPRLYDQPSPLIQPSPALPNRQVSEHLQDSADPSIARVTPKGNISAVFACSQCDITFEKLYLLKYVLLPCSSEHEIDSYSRHQKSHTLNFKCTSCLNEPGFRYKKDLDRHRRQIHSEGDRFWCPVEKCKFSRAKGKGCARRDNYRRHMRDQHKLEI